MRKNVVMLLICQEYDSKRKKVRKRNSNLRQEKDISRKDNS